MSIPKRIRSQEGQHALVDNVPFKMPVKCTNSPAVGAIFPCDPEKAAQLLPGNEVHPFRLWNKALLVVTVINYLETNIGKYIEYSIAIACTQGRKPAPRSLPGLFMKSYGTGQYVLDLPVSSEISVKGGKGIWGMPKHQANLDFKIEDQRISSQYDLDGRLATYLEIQNPGKASIPLKLAAANYCAFRGMLMKSLIYFGGRAWLGMGGRAQARFVIGDHPRVQMLKELDIAEKPLATFYLPSITGVLDDTVQSTFITEQNASSLGTEGFESVIDLGLSEEWLDPPSAPIPPGARGE